MWFDDIWCMFLTPALFETSLVILGLRTQQLLEELSCWTIGLGEPLWLYVAVKFHSSNIIFRWRVLSAQLLLCQMDSNGVTSSCFWGDTPKLSLKKIWSKKTCHISTLYPWRSCLIKMFLISSIISIRKVIWDSPFQKHAEYLEETWRNYLIPWYHMIFIHHKIFISSIGIHMKTSCQHVEKIMIYPPVMTSRANWKITMFTR